MNRVVCGSLELGFERRGLEVTVADRRAAQVLFSLTSFAERGR